MDLSELFYAVPQTILLGFDQYLLICDFLTCQ